MQTAPSVDFPVGRFFISAWAGLALASLSLAGFSWATYFGQVALETSLAFFFLWFALAFFTHVQLRPGQAKSWLSWDGAKWQIHALPALEFAIPPESAPSRTSQFPGTFLLQVHLDLQQCLFVSLVNEQGKRYWFWVLQKSFPDRWHGFRCAVYSANK